MWRSLVAALGAIVAITGVAAAAPVRDTSARLTIEASTGPVSSVLLPSEASLDCNGRARGTGFLRKAANPACALVLRGAVTKVATAQRSARLCSDQYGGPQVARIRGTVGARRVAVTITRADGCGIEEWNRLAALLGDPERQGAMPRPARTTATTTTAPAATYRVQRGDTLTAIAKRFHTSVAAIATANGLADADQLTEGQPLVMPPPSAVRIDAELIDGQPESGFKLTLVGAAPSELVTFVITRPDGSTYTGSAHTASGNGVVTTTYDAAIGSGTYTVTATGGGGGGGGGGTNAQAAFHVVEPG